MAESDSSAFLERVSRDWLVGVVRLAAAQPEIIRTLAERTSDFVMLPVPRRLIDGILEGIPGVGGIGGIGGASDVLAADLGGDFGRGPDLGLLVRPESGRRLGPQGFPGLGDLLDLGGASFVLETGSLAGFGRSTDPRVQPAFSRAQLDRLTTDLSGQFREFARLVETGDLDGAMGHVAERYFDRDGREADELRALLAARGGASEAVRSIVLDATGIRQEGSEIVLDIPVAWESDLTDDGGRRVQGWNTIEARYSRTDSGWKLIGLQGV